MKRRLGALINDCILETETRVKRCRGNEAAPTGEHFDSLRTYIHSLLEQLRLHELELSDKDIQLSEQQIQLQRQEKRLVDSCSERLKHCAAIQTAMEAERAENTALRSRLTSLSIALHNSDCLRAERDAYRSVAKRLEEELRGLRHFALLQGFRLDQMLRDATPEATVPWQY